MKIFIKYVIVLPELYVKIKKIHGSWPCLYCPDF